MRVSLNHLLMNEPTAATGASTLGRKPSWLKMKMPGGARKQLTFSAEPVGGGPHPGVLGAGEGVPAGDRSSEMQRG